METMNHILTTSPKEGRGDLNVPDSLRQDLRIRLADSADWARMAQIYNEAIHSGQSTMDLIPVDASYFRKLVDGFTSRECLLIAQHAGHVAGWGIVKLYSDRPGYALACEMDQWLQFILTKKTDWEKI